MKFKIIGILVGIAFLSGVAFAINSIAEGYKIIKGGGTASIGNPYYYCFKNNNPNNSYFIPTATDTEFDSFNTNKPSGVTKIRCKPAFSERNVSWEIRNKNLDRTEEHPDCGSLPINYLFIYSPFGNYEQSSSNISDLTSITSVEINGRTVYKGDLYSDDIGQCSPYSGKARQGWKIEY